MKPVLKKQIETLLKISVSVGLVCLILSQLDWGNIIDLVKQTRSFSFVLGLLFFLTSHFVSVLRFDVFIRKIGIRLGFGNHLRLYLLGMFYNFFIPGGVGGDAYKVYLLNKTYRKSLKRIGEIVFIERFLGVVAIGFLASVLILFIPSPLSWIWHLSIGISGVLLTLLVLKWVIRYLHTYKKRIYLVFGYSVIVQFLQLFCVYFILKAFLIDSDELAYLLFFLISSVLSIVSFAGIGIREAVFYYGAKWHDFNPDVSAVVALCFSVFTTVTSLFGIIYLFKGIQLRKPED